MGRDIHLNIVRDGVVIDREFYSGRNYEWFNNMAGKGESAEYDYLKIQYGIPGNLYDDTILNDYNEQGNGCFDFRYITVGDFIDWAKNYQPWRHATWATTYEAWAIMNKGYVPEFDKTYLDSDDNVADMKFVEYEDLHDPSYWLFEYLTKGRYEALESGRPHRTDLLVYYFDN
jgi:hypothetical protein